MLLAVLKDTMFIDPQIHFQSGLFFFFVLKNIKKKMYGCTEAFLADAKWILHNCIIYNGGKILFFAFLLMISLFFLINTIYLHSLGNHKLTATAKVIVKICEHEVSIYIYIYNQVNNGTEDAILILSESFHYLLADERD